MFGETAGRPVATNEGGARASILRIASTSASGQPDIARLISDLGPDPQALVALFVSPRADFRAVMERAQASVAEAHLIGCTTAGEITDIGYDDDKIVAVGFPLAEFAAEVLYIDRLQDFVPQDLTDRIVQTRVALTDASPEKPHGFAFLLVDGLSLREDALVSAISPAMAGLPLFGGSAGDGTDFNETQVAVNGKTGANAAALALVRSRCKTKVFTLNHLVPEDTRMVVTDADPARRIVKEINAEPAAREYARIVGKDPDQLNQFIFAAHPVIVRIGDEHHVRSIQRVNENGELVFFSAIDEGMVLCVAQPENMTRHLDEQLAGLGGDTKPDAVLACDCILRRIEAQQSQQFGEISKVLGRYNVTGFSTYGEQFGPLHVNQTMTGVAFFDTPVADAD